MDLRTQAELKSFTGWLWTSRWLARERKFNPNHDAANGRSTSGGSTASHGPSVSARTGRRGERFYLGMTSSGVGIIKPTSGGYFDRSGKYVPEVFPPDPYGLTDPATAMAHYVGGTGEDRNYYLNSVGTSQVKLDDFPKNAAALKSGQPGIYEFSGTKIKQFDSGRPFEPHKLSAAATVGRLGMQADGTLTITPDLRYTFDGSIGVDEEQYRFPKEKGRSRTADGSTWIGRQFPGKEFRVHIIGAHALYETGEVRSSR